MCTELEDHLHFDYVRLAWDTGFCFDIFKSKSIFDFNALGIVDIDKVTANRDIATVEKHIPTILQFQLDEELAKILEPTFVKVFRLCQLAVQYLRFCKKYLDSTVIILKKDLAVAYEENKIIKHQLEEYKHDIDNLKQKNKDLKDTIQCFNPTASYKCNECTKVFYSEEYLTAHQKRRHDSSEKSLLQTESDKLQLEIKELKQRLNNTEKYIQIDKQEVKPVPNNDIAFVKDNNIELQNKFDKLKENIEKELSSLKDESFFKNIYEKWFDDAFKKIQNQPKMHTVDQGTGDFVAFTESATQTNIIESIGCTTEESGFVNQSTSTTPTPRQRNDVINDENKDKKLILELEEKLKNNTEIYREELENVMDQRITGSLERLETQISSFWTKLSNLEQKKEDKQQTTNLETFSPKIGQGHIQIYTPTIAPRKITQTLYISKKDQPKQTTKNQTHESTESESDLVTSSEISSLKHVEVKKIPPKPIPRTTPLMVTSHQTQNVEKKVKNSLINIKSMDFNKKATNNVDQELIPTLKRNKSSIHVSQKNSIKKQNVPIQEKIVANEIQKNIVSSQSSLTTESDDERFENKVETNTSNISTLAQRSLTSLKNAVIDSNLTEGLKKELDDVVSLRLKEMGVAPQWKGLPKKSYQRALEIIKHQASLMKKNVSNFDDIRAEIIVELDTHIKDDETVNKKSIRKEKTIVINKKKPENRRPQKRQKPTTKSVDNIKQDNFFEQKENPVTEIKPIQNVPIIKPRQIVQIKNFDTSDTSTIDNKIQPTKVDVPENKTEIALIETPNRSVLKISSQTGQWTNKKKVIFNLDSDESSEMNMKNEVKKHSLYNTPGLMEGGSTTSIASSVLDESKVPSKTLGKENIDLQRNHKEQVKDEDISDWDISDILN